MGLLDEAIREHLELKRRSGADPTAVEREEREALAPGFPDDDLAPDGDLDRQLQSLTVEAGPADPILAEDQQAADARLADARLAELSSIGQDTAELDMRTVLGEDLEAHEAGAPLGAVRDGAQAAYAAEGPLVESLQWDVASDPTREPPPADVPGQERLSFD